MISKYVIIGAGYSGLQLAQGLKPLQTSVRILEKSRGVGGRLATRREGQFTFDHGAQFIKHCSLNSQQIQTWKEQGALNRLNNDAYTVFGGMTRIAKKLAENIDILFETKIANIQQDNQMWVAINEQGGSHLAENLILSCPLPQSLDILRNSHIPYDSALDAILYAKAIVFLIKDERVLEFMEAYKEVNSANVFSLASQFKKGTSILPCWTMTMKPEWSEQFFEKSEEEIIHAAQEDIAQLLPHILPDAVSVKKWRFSHPLSSHYELYTMPQNNLYLIGDAFGGASLNGAHRSAHALLKHLENL